MISGENTIILLRDLANPKTIKELSHSDSFPEPVFTFDGNRFTVGWLQRIVYCGKMPVKRLMLDNQDSLSISKDQKLLTIDGNPITLSDGLINKSLLPLYLGEVLKYPTYREVTRYNLDAKTSIDSSKVRKVSRMVAEAKLSMRLIPNTHVKHIDRNKYNCHPVNLDVIQKQGEFHHKVIHPFVKAVIEAQNAIKEHKDYKDHNPYKKPKNHKVVEILEDISDVYACVVTPLNNLPVNGVFIQTMDDE